MTHCAPTAIVDQADPVPVTRLRDVSLRYGTSRALDAVSLALPAGGMVRLIGLDGVGKSNLLSLIAGARLIARIRADRPGMSVLVATAYMDEAARFDWLAAMADGRVLATGTPQELLKRTNALMLAAPTTHFVLLAQGVLYRGAGLQVVWP